MQVVDDQRERPVGGEVQRQPVEAVEHSEGGVLRHALGGRAEDWGRGLRRVRKPVPGRPARDERFEQLPHDAEREGTLELRPARSEDAEAVLAGLGPQRREQAALADAGRPLDDGDARPSGGGACDQLVHGCELAVALDERGRGRSGRHGPDATRRSGRSSHREDDDHEHDPRDREGSSRGNTDRSVSRCANAPAGVSDLNPTALTYRRRTHGRQGGLHRGRMEEPPAGRHGRGDARLCGSSRLHRQLR